MATAEEAKTVTGVEDAASEHSTTDKLESDGPKTLSAEELEAKKRARATRFGIPLNETKTETKKVGTGTTGQAGANKENRKRPAATSMKTKELTIEEVETIKKRSEKFGTTDSEQYLHALAEEKRLKRAARFSTGDVAVPTDTTTETSEEPAAKKVKASE